MMVTNHWLVVSNHGMDYFPFHIWVVIRNPLTKSMIFQRGRLKPPTREVYLKWMVYFMENPWGCGAMWDTPIYRWMVYFHGKIHL